MRRLDSRTHAVAHVPTASTCITSHWTPLRQLAQTLPDEHGSLRFWGRITTRSSDYVIVEGKATADVLGEFDESVQEGKDGSNRYVYWVASSAGNDWQRLPPVTQAQIVAARKVRV